MAQVFSIARNLFIAGALAMVSQGNFSCPGCGLTLSANQESAGELAQCPQCGQGVLVPPFEATNFREYWGRHWEQTHGLWILPVLGALFAAAGLSWVKASIGWRGLAIAVATVAAFGVVALVVYSSERMWAYFRNHERIVAPDARSRLARIAYGSLAVVLFPLGPLVIAERFAAPEGLVRLGVSEYQRRVNEPVERTAIASQLASDKLAAEKAAAAKAAADAFSTVKVSTVKVETTGETDIRAAAPETETPPNSNDGKRDIKRVDREPRIWAVTMGVGKYQHVPPLSLTVKDAQDLAETLHLSGGVPTEQILQLTDAEPAVRHPNAKNLREQLPKWLDQAYPQDTVIVFFAGHGFVDAQGMFLAPQDLQLDDKAVEGLGVQNGLALSWLRSELGKCKAGTKVLLLDACHSGSLRSGSVDGEHLAQAFNNLEGVITIASCKGSQLSLESKELKNGLFSHFLVRGLGGDADVDRDRRITVDELYGYLHAQVGQAAEKLGAKQTPVRSIFGGAGVPVVLQLAGAPPDVKPLITQENPTIEAGETKPFAADFDNVTEGGLPPGWKADDTVVVRKTKGRARIEAPESGQRVIKLPPQSIAGDFTLELEFEAGFGHRLDVTLLGEAGRPDLPFTVNAGQYTSNVSLPGGESPDVGGATAVAPIKLRLERQGVIYRLSLNDKLAHARRLQEYQAFSGIKLGLTGGVGGAGSISKLYSVRVGPFVAAVLRAPSTAGSKAEGFSEDFKQAVVGGLPAGWTGDDSIGVRNDDGPARLQIAEKDWQHVTTPKISLKGDFFVEADVELGFSQPMTITLLNADGSGELPILIDPHQYSTSIKLGQGEPQDGAGSAVKPFKLRLEREGSIYRISVNGQISQARRISESKDFAAIRLGFTGGIGGANSITKFYALRTGRFVAAAKKLD